jgi:hypothetical protein
MSQIVERLERALIDFELYSGKQPNAIYLGQTEHFALMSWYESLTYEAGQPNRKLTEFQGVPIFKLNTENNHLGVGMCPE